MSASGGELDRLEQKIEKLKREYELYLNGNRRTEPSALRAEVERDILRITRHPFSSTAARFRVKSLAYRFRAAETQVRNLIEQRNRALAAAEGANGAAESVLIDRSALDDPARLEERLRKMHRAVAGERGGRAGPELDGFRRRLLEEARSRLQTPGVQGIRFSVVRGDGSPRLRGEVVKEGKPPEPNGDATARS